MIKELGFLSYKERLESLGFFSLEKRWPRVNMIEAYKIIHEMEKADRGSFFSLFHNTRLWGQKLLENRVRTDKMTYFFTQQQIKLWNPLLVDVVIDTSSIDGFKWVLDRLMEKRSINRLLLWKEAMCTTMAGSRWSTLAWVASMAIGQSLAVLLALSLGLDGVGLGECFCCQALPFLKPYSWAIALLSPSQAVHKILSFTCSEHVAGLQVRSWATSWSRKLWLQCVSFVLFFSFF